MKSTQRCLSFVLAASCLACTPGPLSPVTGAPAPVTAAAVAPAEGAAPAAPSDGTPVAPAAADALTGQAMSFDGPFTSGTVTLHELGSEDVVATAAIGANGSYALTVPASVADGTLLELRAVQGQETLAALVVWDRTKSYRLAAAAPALNPASTSAFIVMKTRLRAIGRLMGKRPNALVIAAALASFNEVVTTMQTILTNASAVLQKAVLGGLQTGSDIRAFNSAIRAVSGVADLLDEVVAAQASLMDAIEANVSPTDLQADTGLTASQDVGGVTSPGIPTDSDSDGSNGSSGSSGPTTTDASGTIGVEEGGLVYDEAATTTITLSDPPIDNGDI